MPQRQYGCGALGLLDEVDGALVLSLAQERRSLSRDPWGFWVWVMRNLLG